MNLYLDNYLPSIEITKWTRIRISATSEWWFGLLHGFSNDNDNSLEKKWDCLGMSSCGLIHVTILEKREEYAPSSIVLFSLLLGMAWSLYNPPTWSSCPWSFCALMDAWYAASLKTMKSQDYRVRHRVGISILDRFLGFSQLPTAGVPKLFIVVVHDVFDRRTGGQQALKMQQHSGQKPIFWCALSWFVYSICLYIRSNQPKHRE